MTDEFAFFTRMALTRRRLLKTLGLAPLGIWLPSVRPAWAASPITERAGEFGELSATER